MIIRQRVKAALLAGVVALGAGGALAQDAPADPAFEEARIGFEGMTVENRILIQRSLPWVVPFNGAALGTFGKLTYNGIRAFEKKAKLDEKTACSPPKNSTLWWRRPKPRRRA